jgi:hypothetical protein
VWNKRTVHEKTRKTHNDVIVLSQWAREVGHLERLFAMFQVRGDGEVGDDEQEKNEEGTDTDGPGEADLGHQVDSHEREDDASE